MSPSEGTHLERDIPFDRVRVIQIAFSRRETQSEFYGASPSVPRRDRFATVLRVQRFI